MKKYFFIIFFLIAYVLYGQVGIEIRALPTYSGTVGASDYIPMSLSSDGKTYKYPMSLFAQASSSLLSKNNTWSGTNTFNNQSSFYNGIIFGSGGYLQLPSVSYNQTPRQIWFDGTYLYVKDGSGNNIPFASKAYGDATYATSGGQTDLGATFMTLATNQVVTGQKTYSNRLFFNNSVRFPVNKTTESTGGYLAFDVADSYNPIFTVANGTWKYLATREWVSANYSMSQADAFLPTTGSKLDATSSLAWTSGYVKPYDLRLQPNQPAGADLGSMWMQIGAYPYVEVMQYAGQTFTLPSLSYTQWLIDKAISYNVPTSSSANALTISMLNNNSITHNITQGSDSKTITISDYADGRFVIFRIKDLTDPCTISISGVTLDWGDQPATNFSDGAWYVVQLVALSNTVCGVHYIRYNR